MRRKFIHFSIQPFLKILKKIFCFLFEYLIFIKIIYAVLIFTRGLLLSLKQSFYANCILTCLQNHLTYLIFLLLLIHHIILIYRSDIFGTTFYINYKAIVSNIMIFHTTQFLYTFLYFLSKKMRNEFIIDLSVKHFSKHFTRLRDIYTH